MKNNQKDTKGENRNREQEELRNTREQDTRKEGEPMQKNIKANKDEVEGEGTKMPGRDTRTPVAGSEKENVSRNKQTGKKRNL